MFRRLRRAETRIAELEQRIHTLEQHRRVELNRTDYLRLGHRLAVPDAAPEERDAAVADYLERHPLHQPDGTHMTVERRIPTADAASALQQIHRLGDSQPYRFGGHTSEAEQDTPTAGSYRSTPKGRGPRGE